MDGGVCGEVNNAVNVIDQYKNCITSIRPSVYYFSLLVFLRLLFDGIYSLGSPQTSAMVWIKCIQAIQ